MLKRGVSDLNKVNSPLFSTQPLFYFAVLFFTLSLGDAVMSYVSPVIIEKHLNNVFLMGLVVSTSSIAGFVVDYILGKVFGNRSYLFFMLWGCLLAILFPGVFTFLPPITTFFVFGMVVWGLYFELLEFGIFAYIRSFHQINEHAKVWGLISSFRSASYMIGPALATYILSNGEKTALSIVTLLFAFCLIGYMLFWRKFGMGDYHKYSENSENLPFGRYFLATFTIFKHVWPVWIFTLVLYIVDATFWTTGTLFSEFLGTQHKLGNLFMSIYMAPFVIGGLMTSFIARPFGKKRIAYFGGLIHGLTVMTLGIITNVPSLLLVVFISAFFAAIAVPEILATAEDYVTRLKGMGSIIVSLNLTAASFGYVIGPILGGYISEVFNMQTTFIVVGGLLSVCSVIMFFVTPKKIHLPQVEIHDITSQI